jgi:catechol-2,3-dioxygenase
MRISHLDHLVLTVAEIEATCNFYQHVLNFEVIEFGENRKALKFGSQKSIYTKQGMNLNRKPLSQPKVLPIFALSAKRR